MAKNDPDAPADPSTDPAAPPATSTPPADEPAPGTVLPPAEAGTVSMSDVAALSGVTVVAPAAPTPAPFLSAGMAHDLESFGTTRDPVSGARFVKDAETGAVTWTDAAGNTGAMGQDEGE